MVIGRDGKIIGRDGKCAGADYGLGTIGTCLGPPPAWGPPSDQKKIPMITEKENKRK